MIALAGACAVPMPQIPAGMHTPQVIPPQRMKSCADCLSKHCKRSPRQPRWIQEAPQVCMECTRQQCGPPICTPEKRQAHCHSELKANNASATATGPAPMLPARAEGRFSMDLWSGLRAQQDIEPMKCGLLYFVHVPKTGGTTVFNRLKDLGWGYNRLYWGEDDEESKRWVADPERWKNSSAWQWLQKSLAEHWTPRIILEAHHGAPGLEYMAKHVLNKVACTMQARGCQVRIVTMLRSPYDRTLSTLIFNSNGLPPEDNALGFLRWDAEEQARYLVAGHISQWPDEWRSDRPENVVDDKLVARAQDALSYAYLVGNLRQLDAFMESVYTLLGANKPAGGDENFNVNSQDAEVELSEPLRNMLHHVTQSDRYLYNTWFSGGKRPVPFQELCEEGSATQAEAAGIGLPPIMVNPLDWCWPLPWCIPRP